MDSFLPYGKQSIDDADIEAVVAVLKSDWLTTGPAVQAFEDAFALKVDAPHAVACSSATAGLHLAALAAGIGPGDRTIVPANTFLATANASRYVGAEVVFADVDPDTGVMRASDLEAAFERAGGAVKAVFPVQFAGQMESPELIRQIATDHGALVIEDACHALGASYSSASGEHALGSCSHADMSVFSFHPVKTIAMGEGGAVTTRSPQLAERLKRLSSHGMMKSAASFSNPGLGLASDGNPNPWYYEMQEVGFNYRASDIHCALGLSQLNKLEPFVTQRRALAKHYDELLKPLANWLHPTARLPGCNPAWHLYVVLIDFKALGRDRASVMNDLKERGIGTQVHYVPVPWQPYFQSRYGELPLPGTAHYYERCLSLPLFPAMTEGDVDRVVSELKNVLKIA